MSGELPTNRDRNVVLGFLLLAYTLSFVDRSIIGIIGQSIKLEFVLTDTQIGLLGGLAQNFWQLLVARAGVGIGEAGLSPAAHSLISDYFEPGRRASALSIYALGIPIGAMIAAMAGGWIAQELGWRFAWLLVGLPGVLVALAFRTFVRERRGGGGPEPAPNLSLRHESAELRAVISVRASA